MNLLECGRIIQEMDQWERKDLDKLLRQSHQRCLNQKKLEKCRRWLKNKRKSNCEVTTRFGQVQLNEMDKSMLIDLVLWLSFRVDEFIAWKNKIIRGENNS